MEARFFTCYEKWFCVQSADLNQLLQATSSSASTGNSDDLALRELVEESMRHYEEYAARRRVLVREDAPIFFSPPWCNSFENSLLWVGGCRPSLFFRLVETLSASSPPASSSISCANFHVVLSPPQLERFDELRHATGLEEERISTQVATLQEDVADRPLLPVLKERGMSEDYAEVEATIGKYVEAMAALVEEADRLRVETARALLTDVLTSRQAAEVLVAGKQLHLAVHDWGSSPKAQEVGPITEIDDE